LANPSTRVIASVFAEVPMAALRGRLRTYRGNLLLLLGGIALGLITAELATRLVAPQRRTRAFIPEVGQLASIHQLDANMGLVLKSNLDETFIFGTRLATNSLGLRDREIGPKQPGELRVLSLGDSYAFGYGVELEQMYAKVLERGLSRQLSPTVVSVINAGVVGYGTQQQRIAFQRLRGKVQPDFVLATFAAGNDVYDNAVFEEQIRTHLQTPLGLVGRHSHLMRLLLKVTFPIWFFLENRDPDHIAHTVELLRELESDFLAAQVPFLVLVIPARHQIRPEVEPAANILMDLGFDGLVFRQNRRVIQHFREDSIPFVDLWEPLVARDQQMRVSFTDDSHLNAIGHEVIAQQILPRVIGSLPAATHPR
jgi:lysophospholipase L1-like esterase